MRVIFISLSAFSSLLKTLCVCGPSLGFYGRKMVESKPDSVGLGAESFSVLFFYFTLPAATLRRAAHIKDRLVSQRSLEIQPPAWQGLHSGLPLGLSAGL